MTPKVFALVVVRCLSLYFLCAGFLSIGGYLVFVIAGTSQHGASSMMTVSVLLPIF